MSRLMRTSEIAKRPVVTRAGDDIAQVKDIVYAAAGGSVVGFTLAGRGLFAGPLKQSLAWSKVSALGADAVMVTDESAFDSLQSILDASASSGGTGADVLGSRVLTDGGTDLGKVIDVILEVGGGPSSPCDVVGYEIEAAEPLASGGSTMLIPLPDTISVSGEHLMVPASATSFVRQDLAGFGAAVEAFRSQLEGPH